MEPETCNTLPKKERLCGKKSISLLLAKGKYGNVPDMKYVFLKNNGEECSRIMVSVPKKLFKRAVKRNLLKRRIRESYRRQKHLLTAESGLDVLFIYSSREVLPYNDIYTAVGAILKQISSRSPRHSKLDLESQ